MALTVSNAVGDLVDEGLPVQDLDAERDAVALRDSVNVCVTLALWDVEGDALIEEMAVTLVVKLVVWLIEIVASAVSDSVGPLERDLVTVEVADHAAVVVVETDALAEAVALADAEHECVAVCERVDVVVRATVRDDV